MSRRDSTSLFLKFLLFAHMEVGIRNVDYLHTFHPKISSVGYTAI